MCAVCRSNVQFWDGAECTLCVERIAFIQGDKSCRMTNFIPGDEYKIFLPFKEALKSGRRFGKVEIEGLNTDSGDDFVQ